MKGYPPITLLPPQRKHVCLFARRDGPPATRKPGFPHSAGAPPDCNM